MLWIPFAGLTLILSIALGMLWRFYTRQIRRLHHVHAESIKRIDTEHSKQVNRLSREHEQKLLTAHHPLANELLPAMDCLDQALDQVAENTPESLEAFQEGMELARANMIRALERHGITMIAPDEGASFDPHHHEAISRVEDPTRQPGTVAVCHRPGYRDGERVLRAATVSTYYEGDRLEDGESSPASESSSLDSSSDAPDLAADTSALAGDSPSVPDSRTDSSPSAGADGSTPSASPPSDSPS